MAYCRFSDGDVYLFEHVNGHVQCDACKLEPAIPHAGLKVGDVEIPAGQIHKPRRLMTRSAALLHLAEHRAAGHRVPEKADLHLQTRIAQQGEVVPRHTGERLLESLFGQEGPIAVLVAPETSVLTYDQDLTSVDRELLTGGK